MENVRVVLDILNEKRVRKFSRERRDSSAAQDVFEVCGCVLLCVEEARREISNRRVNNTTLN
jgi:hypothetical protein